MGRDLRFIPPGGALVEVTCRTIQGRSLLRPACQLNEIIVGALGRANRLYPIEIVAGAFLSTHFHLLAWTDNARMLGRFMGYLNSKLAKEVARMHHWHDKIWARRYDAIVVSDEERAQLERLRYVLSHGVKEGLVERPEEWPGVHTAQAMRTGENLQGFWFDRTKEQGARQRDEEFMIHDYAEPESLQLAPLPCWRHLEAAEHRARVGEMVEEIVEQARRARGDRPVKGPEAILRQNPHEPPVLLKRSPKPRFHAASKKKRRELEEAYSIFYAEFRVAADRQKEGERDVQFPAGSFPPALPFVEPGISSRLSRPSGEDGGAMPVLKQGRIPGPRRLFQEEPPQAAPERQTAENPREPRISRAQPSPEEDALRPP